LKANIEKVGLWWKWDEYCDNCGKQIRDDKISSSTEPEIGILDYCDECLKKNIDNKKQ
jgi:NAD-dependent SIR2 family protein deacetylase